MGWSISADEKVVDSVISCFRDSAVQSSEPLLAVKHRDWERAYPWLVASGMALYFLDRIQALQLEHCLPYALIERLSQNLEDNRKRADFMMEEFIAINEAFVRRSLRYCNIKGFTLSPCYCPDSALRNQLDFDFLVDERDLECCRSILSKMGYTRTVATEVSWEFKAGSSELVSMADHYKPGPQRSVELHFCSSASAPHVLLHNEWAARIEQRTWHGRSFPVLSPADQFLVQALHLFSHLRTQYTRLSWLFEYHRFVFANQDNRDLWKRVREYASSKQDTYIAIGLASLLSSYFFGHSAPAYLNKWTLDCLPTGVRLWAERYGRRSVLSSLPGTKLYLLLEGELASGDDDWQQTRRKRLLPLHSVPPITVPTPNETLWRRARRELHQIMFVLFRARFHVVEGLRYLVEARRWKRVLAEKARDSRSIRSGQPRLNQGGIEDVFDASCSVRNTPV